MRRLVVLLSVVLLGLASLGMRSVSADVPEWDTAWQDVGFPMEGGDSDARNALRNAFIGDAIGNRLGSYLVPFDKQYAHIPELGGVEFMLAYVNVGNFVVDVKGPAAFLVDPAPETGDTQSVEILIGTIDGHDISYEANGEAIRDEKGAVCRQLCTVPPGTAVNLTEGDWIIAPGGSVCLWCLLSESTFELKPQAQLFIYPLLRPGHEFSWQLFHPNPPQSGLQPTPESTPQANLAEPARVSGAPVIMSWAFNPPPNCQKGSG
jgi:hypothetical protein